MIARKSGRLLLEHLLVVIAAGLMAMVISSAIPQRHLIQGWLIDVTTAARAAVFGTRPLSNAGVVVVTVGSRSLDSPELGGLPRALFAPIWSDLISKALDAGARLVALDFILAYDAGRMAIDGRAPLDDFNNDFLRLLYDEGREGRIILGRSAQVLPAARFRQVLGPGGLGLVEAPVGPGNVVRRMRYAVAASDGSEMETLSGLALKNVGVTSPAYSHMTPTAPVDTLPSVELIDVLRCDEQAPLQAVFDDRLVFVGSALAGEDRLRGAGRLIPDGQGAPLPARARARPSGDPCRLLPEEYRDPQDGSVPGVFLQAAAADAVLSGWAPRPVPDTARLLLVGIAATIGAALAIFCPVGRAIAGIILLALTLFAGRVVLLEEGVLLASADPLLAALVFFIAGWVVRVWLLDRQARAIRRAFGRYLAPALVQRMVEQDATPELGGESRMVTVMFADLTGFTRLSGTVDERALFRVVNDYLDRCARIVREHDGYVDKFVGDAVMAIWNAPAEQADHARLAVEAGLAMEREVDALRVSAAAAGRPGLKIKIAINTGPALVGNVGSRERMNYTVLGATVNVASRLEELPRIFDTPVVLGESTARAVEDAFALLPVASARLDGVTDPVEIFSPLAAAGACDDRLRGLILDYGHARKLAGAASFDEAIAIWQRLAAEDWPGAGPSAVMLRRAVTARGRAVAATVPRRSARQRTGR